MSNLHSIFRKYAAVVFFDTETTGLDAKTCQIIELAAIRIEQAADGSLHTAGSADMFIKLPEGERIPEKIVELTGISDAMLEAEGVTEAMATRSTILSVGLLHRADYLDSLTVYKDRRAYPHKLANAIAAYKLEDKVQNSHRAIDDVEALLEVCKAMDDERPDLLTYVNLFGYNPKYGVSGDRLAGVTYWPQHFNDYMQSPRYTLPARAKRR